MITTDPLLLPSTELAGDAGSIAIIFANLKGNIGDFAILHAMLNAVVGSGRTVDVYSHDFLPFDEARYAAFVEAGAPPFRLAGTTYFAPVPRQLKRVRRLGMWPIIQRLLIARLSRAARTDAARFKPYDAIYLAGGDHWNGMDLAISMFATLEAVAAYNSAIYAFPFSVNPAITRYNTSGDLKRRFRLICGPLVVRDVISKTVMDGLGVSAVLRSDCVYSLRNLATAIPAKSQRDSDRVLLAPTGPRQTELEANLRPVLKRLIGQGLKVDLLTTCEPEDGFTFANLAREFGLQVLAPLTWQETVSELRSARLVLTNRLHCLILGTFTDTPLVPIADREKSAAFVRDVNMPHHFRHLSEIEPELVERAYLDRDTIVRRMHAYRDASRAQQGALTAC